MRMEIYRDPHREVFLIFLKIQLVVVTRKNKIFCSTNKQACRKSQAFNNASQPHAILVATLQSVSLGPTCCTERRMTKRTRMMVHVLAI